MINYEVVKNWAFQDIVHSYTQRDTQLYALGVGYGQDPTDQAQLRFVYEKELQALPTMAAVMGSPGLWLGNPLVGADVVKLVHGEQDMRFLKPLPTAATLVARNRVISLTDKGVGKGAIAVVMREIIDQGSGETLVESRNVTFLRGDGGFSAQDGRSDPPPPLLPAVPDRVADLDVAYTTRPETALLYRLNGDYNPLHADPDVAKRAGFQAPILHGLCFYGMAARAVVETVLGGDASRLKRLAVRFTSPVWPGETVRYEIWREGANHLHLRAVVDARQTVVLNNGLVEIEAD